MRNAKVEQDRRQMRREFKCGLVCADRLFIFSQPREHDAQIRVGLGVIGLAFEDRPIFADGILELALLLKRDGAIELRGDLRRLIRRLAGRLSGPKRKDEKNCEKQTRHIDQTLAQNESIKKGIDFSEQDFNAF